MALLCVDTRLQPSHLLIFFCSNRWKPRTVSTASASAPVPTRGRACLASRARRRSRERSCTRRSTAPRRCVAGPSFCVLCQILPPHCVVASSHAVELLELSLRLKVSAPVMYTGIWMSQYSRGGLALCSIFTISERKRGPLYGTRHVALHDRVAVGRWRRATKIKIVGSTYGTFTSWWDL